MRHVGPDAAKCRSDRYLHGWRYTYTWMFPWSRGKMFNFQPLAKRQMYLAMWICLSVAKSISLKGWMFLGIQVHLLLPEWRVMPGRIYFFLLRWECCSTQCLYRPQVLQITIFRSSQQHRGGSRSIARAASLLLVNSPALAQDYCFTPVKVVNKLNVCTDRCWNPERQLLPVAKHFQDVVP